MNSYETIVRALEKEFQKKGMNIAFSLNQPEDFFHGDYTTNAAFLFAKEKNVSPKLSAEELVVFLQEELTLLIEKIEIAGPGFINFFLKDDVVRTENGNNVVDITTKYSGKNVLVEHSSPNLFKPFHIGHLMNNIIGEFVVRAMITGGVEKVTTLSFPSDVSLGIAKAIYIILEDKKQGIDILETKNEAKIIPYLGECYVRGVKLAEENPELESKIKELSHELFNQIDGGSTISSDVYDLYTEARTINLTYFKHVIESLGSHIDSYIFESEAGNVGKELVTNNPTIFIEGERGAIIYIPDEARKDLHTAVFVNSEGHPTYEAKDLGLIDKKFADYGSVDYSFFVTDSEQNSHFKLVLDAASKLGGDWNSRVEKSIHVPHGRMLFKGQKMSSRLGGVPLALDVIGVVEEEVREKAGDKIAHLGDEEKKELEREIALSSLRIAVLRSKPGININFDPETSLSFEGDSGPYLLYTHARTSSLLDKGNEKGYSPKFGTYDVSSLERELIHFDEVLIESINTLAPQKLVTYFFKVAQEFNSFYGNTQIVGDDKELSEHNLAIVKRTKFVLKEGLHVLGIKAPERM